MRISTPLAPAAPISPHAPGRARTAGVAHGVASALLLSAAGRSLATPVGASPVPLEGLAPPHLNGPLAGRGATPAVGPNPSTFAGCTYDYA
ncbi:MAG TPA: hypothetical protein VFH51_06385, partial [Myxococcota bacterium]|nr:hypothetical protein [Myxococcota bacterium]